MHVEVRKNEKNEDVIIVDLDGHLVAGTGDQLLRDVINELVAEDWRKILIDLSKVERIDSSGIGELVASSRLAARFGTSVRLLKVMGRVRRVLELGQVLPLFRVYEEEDQALAAFADDADTVPSDN